MFLLQLRQSLPILAARPAFPIKSHKSRLTNSRLFNRFPTLPSSVSCNSFVCHSYENGRGVYQQFPKRNVPAPVGMEHPGSRPKGTHMNPQTETPVANPNSVPLHCQHRTASGRRCRMAISESDSGLCSKHAADHQKELDQADLASALIGDIQEFRDAVTINHSLGELYKLQARNKITPRRAAVMAYTANLLLRTLPAIDAEENASPDAPIEIILDAPRPCHDEPYPDTTTRHTGNPA